MGEENCVTNTQMNYLTTGSYDYNGRIVLDRPDCKKVEMTKGDYLRNYDINIKFASSGVIVRLGCKEIAFSTAEEAMVEVNAYVVDPATAYKIWDEKFKQ